MFLVLDTNLWVNIKQAYILDHAIVVISHLNIIQLGSNQMSYCMKNKERNRQRDRKMYSLRLQDS